MIRGFARRLVAQTAIRRPRGLYRIAGWWSGLTMSVDPRPVSVAAVLTVFPHLAPSEAVRTARHIRADAVRTRLLDAALAGTRNPAVFPVARIESVEAGDAGQAVMIGFHFGPVAALGDVVRRSPRRVAAMHRMGWAQPPNTDYVAVAPDELGRAAGFHQVLDAVQRGASVCLLADHHEGLRVPLLGGTITMQRGAFALARMTGLPLVPLLPRWEGSRVHVRVGPVIPAQADERAMAVAVVSALERHLLDHPHAIGCNLLAELADEIQSQRHRVA